MRSYVIYFYYFVVIHLFFSSCKCEKSTKPIWDVQTVCEEVVKTSRLWGSKIIQFKPQCSQRYRGISSKILSTASLLTAYSDLIKTSCYNAFEGPLCYLQFNPYEASPECGDTADLFFNLLKTCFNNPESTAGNCPTLDRKNSYLIGDPEAFCKNAYLEQDGPENPKTGLPTTFTKRKFLPSEIQDCNQIVTAYNSCVYFGQKKLGYPPQFCLSLSFDAYCHHSVQIIEDTQYRLACENVVVPTLMEYVNKHHRPVDKDFCSTLYQRSLVFLAAKKGEAYTWIQKMSNNLQLTAAPLLHVNLLKKPLLKARIISVQYYAAINETEAAFHRMYDSGIHTIPYALVHEFDLLKTVADEIYVVSLRLKLPEAVDTEKVLETVPSVNGELEKLCAMKKKAIDQHADFRSKLSQWLVKSTPYNYKTLAGTYTLPYSNVAALQNTVGLTVSHINDFTHHFSSRLNLWPAKIMKNDAKYVYEGIRQLRLAKLRDMQIKLLISLYFQTNADTFVENILSKNSL